MIYINLGSNDLADKATPGKVVGVLLKMAEKLAKKWPQATVILGQLHMQLRLPFLEYNTRIRAANAALKEGSEKKAWKFRWLAGLREPREDCYDEDGVHLAGHGLRLFVHGLRGAMLLADKNSEYSYFFDKFVPFISKKKSSVYIVILLHAWTAQKCDHIYRVAYGDWLK